MDDQNQSINKLVEAALRENPDVVVTGTDYDERYDSTTIEVAPRKGLATADELNQFMESIRQTSLGQSRVSPAKSEKERLEFGFIRYVGQGQFDADATVDVNVFPNAILACEASRASIGISDLNAMYEFRAREHPRYSKGPVTFDVME
jgi:hypothetical protein